MEVGVLQLPQANTSDSVCKLHTLHTEALAWQKYVADGVVSHLSKRYITNLMSATAARLADDPVAGDDGTDDEPCDRLEGHAGTLTLIAQTLRGSCKSWQVSALVF